MSQASEEELLVLLETQARETARQNLLAFVQYLRPEYEISWHHRVIAEHLERFVRGEIPRLLIETPPRAGKSELVSRNLPAYIFGRYPDANIIACSYSADLASMMNRDVQRIIESQPYRELFPGTCLGSSNIRTVSGSWLRNSDMFEVVDHRGVYRSAGVGGGITGMGGGVQGGNYCLPGTALITTSSGPVAISKIVLGNLRPLVLSFDHETKTTCWRRVVASLEVGRDVVVAVQTIGGRTVVATGEHRFYVEGKGYIPAKSLRTGDRLVVTEKQKQQDVPTLRQTETRQRTDLLGMLPKGATYCGPSFLRFLRKGFCADARGLREVATTWPQRFLLWCAVLAISPCGKAQCLLRHLRSEEKEGRPVLLPQVPNCRKGAAAEKSRCPESKKGSLLSALWRTPRAGATVLHSGLQTSCEQGARRVETRKEILSPLWQRFLEELCAAGLLLQSLREFVARGSHAWGRQFTFPRRHKLLEMVSRDASANLRARLRHVCRLFDQRGLGCASHRRGPHKERGREYDSSLQAVPHETPQSLFDTVLVVGEICDRPQLVYDLQVEGTNNFFADEVLVHNCIIDDPIKNQEEANSSTYRDRLFGWYNSALHTRIHGHPQGILLTLTRWHEADLAGMLLDVARSDKDADQWTILKFEMVKEGESNPLDPRKEGELLWPKRFDEKHVKAVKASLPGQVWASLYQQRPAALEGSIIKREWLRYYDALPEKIDRWWQSWDLTFDDTEHGSYVVGQVWCQAGANCYLVHQYRARIDFSDSVRAVENLTAAYPQATKKLVEKKANGAALLSVLRNKISGLVPVTPHSDKSTRLMAVSPLFEAGNVWLPKRENAPWVNDYIEELVTFPQSTQDDQVDGTSMALADVQQARLDGLRLDLSVGYAPSYWASLGVADGAPHLSSGHD